MKNLLMIIVDQMVSDAISAYRSIYRDSGWLCHYLETPNLDRMAREGVAFLRCESPNPVCGPARACLFTGRRTLENGVTQNGQYADPTLPNLGQWLEKNSCVKPYYCGKWHVGQVFPDVDGPRKIPGFKTLPVGGFATGDLIDPMISHTVCAFLRQYRENDPFFLVASLTDPHDVCYTTYVNQRIHDILQMEDDLFGIADQLPVLPPNHADHMHELYSNLPGHDAAFYVDNQTRFGGDGDEWTIFPQPNIYSPKAWRYHMYNYCRMIERLDFRVGQMLDAVTARGDDTLVVFLADHGESLARHGRINKWKGFEESSRVPLLFWQAGGLEKPHQDQKNDVSLLDLMPTICEYWQIAPPPQMRGLSLLPLLSGETDVLEREVLVGDFHENGRTVTGRGYKYVMKYRAVVPPPFAARYQRIDTGESECFDPQQIDRYEKMPWQLLFNLEQDPWEQNNLYGTPGTEAITRWLQDRLHEADLSLIPGKPDAPH